jgi:hypothetical protein
MKLAKVSDEHLKPGKDIKDSRPGKNNFLYSVFLSFLGVLILIAYVLIKVPPKNVQWIFLLIVLVSYSITILISLVLYAFAKPHGFENEKQIYRRQFKRSFIIGLIVSLLLLLQYYLDIL